MTIFSGRTLVVSLPAAELSTIQVSGSLITFEEAFNLPLSRTLTYAIYLVQSNCQERQISITYLARPEIFTHGLSANWLRSRLGNASEHLCISDASAVKTIDGFRTHIFLYRLAYYDSYSSLFRLMRRAPELLNQVSSQLNTGFSWQVAGEPVQPDPLYLGLLDLPPTPSPEVYPFCFAPHLSDGTAQNSQQSRYSLRIGEQQAESIQYIPLTETGLNDPAFACSVCRHILKAFFGSELLLLLRLPSDRHGELLAVRIARVMDALTFTKTVLPRTAPPNVFWLTSDLDKAPQAAEFSIVLHESFEFWHHSRSFYSAATSIRVEAALSDRLNVNFLPLDVTSIFGSCATRVWLDECGRPQKPTWTRA